MKIAMIGSGAAGSVFAAYLRKGGAELWLVDKYKAHMDKIAADGLVFRTPEGEEVLTGFHTSATAHDIGTMDMVILMVKATQTADVMADTMPCIGPETVVVSLQNGLGNDEVLAQFVETDRILYGSGLIGTELAGPGVCVSKPEKGIQMHFGAVHNNPKADAGHFTAGEQNAVRDRTHQSGSGAAVDQRVSAAADPGPQLFDRFAQTGVVSFICAKINGNIHTQSLRSRFGRYKNGSQTLRLTAGKYTPTHSIIYCCGSLVNGSCSRKVVRPSRPRCQYRFSVVPRDKLSRTF